METIKIHWEDFRERMLGEFTHDQKLDLEKTFYMGAFSSISIIMTPGDHNFADSESSKCLQKIYRECIAFIFNDEEESGDE